MNGITYYDTKDNNSSDNMHDDFLNYPNFKKFIDRNNNSDHENFEESRKYIHREITKTLNANSVKVCRNIDERILPGSKTNKFCLKSMENQSNKKNFSYSRKNDSDIKDSRSLNKFAHCSSNSSSGRRNNEESGLRDQTGQSGKSSIGHSTNCRSMKNLGHARNHSGVNSVSYPNNASNPGSISVNHFGHLNHPRSMNSHRAESSKGNLETDPPPSSQFFHGNYSNELSDNNNQHQRPINYLKKSEMNNEDMDRINEALLLKEKQNLVKHEFFLSQQRSNTPLEQGDNEVTRNLDNFMFSNEDKLGYVRSSSMNSHPYDLVKSSDTMEDVKFSAFTSNEFGSMGSKPPGLLPTKGEDIKKKKAKEKERGKEELKHKEGEERKESEKAKEGEKTKDDEKANEGDNAKVNEKGKKGEHEKVKKGEQEKTKKGEYENIRKSEHENIAHFIKQKILENAKMERGSSGDHFKGSGFFPNSHANSAGVALDSNSNNSSTSMNIGPVGGGMHNGILSGIHHGNHPHRYEVKNHIPGFQRRMSVKKDADNFRLLENDPNKFKKYNHLKDNFHLNNSRRHFYPNVDQRKNNSEMFLTTDINDKVYENNIMYDDYFTIENMETCEEKKEFFKNEGYSNKMKREGSFEFRMHPNFGTKELMTNKKKYFHFAENRDLASSTNYMKNHYYNESNMNEFSLDEVASPYIFPRKDYLGNNFNDEVLGMDVHMEKMEYTSSLLGGRAGDRYSPHGARLPNGVIVAPPLMYHNCNGYAGGQNNHSAGTHADFESGSTHADFGNTSVQGNVGSTTVHTDNNGQEEENETISTLVNEFTLKREENYYQNRSEMRRANEMNKTKSVNIADVSIVFNSNSCSLSNGNDTDMNNNSNVSTSIIPGKAAKRSNPSMFSTYDMVSLKDGIPNGVHGGHISGSVGESGIRGNNHQQTEKNRIWNGVDNGIDNGMENGIEKGIEKVIENVIENGIENGIENENEESVIKLFFGNLAPITTEKDMHNLFSNFGKCDSLIILKDRRSKSRGSGFVTFYNMQEAVNAIKNLNNKIILSGAHKPLEVRFPENKEEKKLRTKLLNAAKWKGKKIAPSGCLPISTEDILNQSTLHLNNGPGGSPGGNHHVPFLNPMETSSYFLTENDGDLYDIKETVSFGFTSGDMMERANANHYACSEDFSELINAPSETTNNTVLTDYVNRVEESSNMCSSSRQNSYKKGQDNFPDDMSNMSLSKQKKEYMQFLPNFLLDNNPHGDVASNSFQSLDETLDNIPKISINSDMEEVNVRSNGFPGALEVNGGLGSKVVHEVVHDKVPSLWSESSTMEEDTTCRHDSIGSAKSFRKGDVQNASVAKGSNFSANGFMEDSFSACVFSRSGFPSSNFPPSSFNSSGGVIDERDEANSYFSSFCHAFPVQSSNIIEHPNNTFFSYLNKDKSLANHNKGKKEVSHHKMDFCGKGGNFPGINELEEINHFRQLTESKEVSEAYQRGRGESDMCNVLLRGSGEITEVGKEENLLSAIYQGNKGMASPPMNDDGYNNMNVHYLGFDLSRLIQINEDILLPRKEDMKSSNQNSNNRNSDKTNSNVGFTSHEVKDAAHLNGKELMASDFYQHGGRRTSSSSSSSNDGNHMNKLNVGHAHGTMDLLNDDLFGNKNFDVNDNLSDEMLQNLISLYAQNKSSMITSHMFSYFNNVLCEINSALDIFNKFSIKTSMKNIAEEESLPE
ncbi:hypothetical protein C922_02389 [Plasmodium inui San Antonio 1]|uniref:RRM domain-containing protein n=1 Tax=Plasmodium inui San Antonio 1 TaxID=1237626 RepID=W7ADU3_9APIC|nr:hypothetical protein C922_02389 [Plasmodium inui San Antonio 1]EUD67239.1 hypothetical protein C922_02389 [Plasmodium inui San Antonio 1]